MNRKGRFHLSAFQIIVFGFVALILLGTALLSLPISSVESGSASFADCFFTATSAVCVTGLAVRDTATYWSAFGQAVILAMIQIGGLGVVTAAVTLSFVSGRRIGLKERSVMQEAIAAPQVGGIVRLTKFLVLGSLLIECCGAVLLMPVFIPKLGWGKGLWYSFFHAISAFCNAGFDLMGIDGQFSSLTGLRADVLLNITVILLIVIGGIGFLVWNDVRQHGTRFKQYRLQSKVVLVTTLAMIIIPFIWFYFLEMTDLGSGERILPALFQSVTLRTAGFNTVDLSRMSGGGQALMILWMLVGGSPGSTAGGMKTTTVAVLLLTAFTVFRRREDVTCFGRRIGEDAVRNAVAILLMYFVLFFIGAVVICGIEKLPLLTCLFETASAVGTVGLTLGITSRLSLVSRAILMVMMFLGRVGGLTLIYAAQATRKSPRSTLPLEKITVG